MDSFLFICKPRQLSFVLYRLKKNELSGEKASFYTVGNTETKATLYHDFLIKWRSKYSEQLISINGRIKSMANEVGALEDYFRPDESDNDDEMVMAINDLPEAVLRQYCIRLSDRLVILGGGGPKFVKAWQDDKTLESAAREVILYSEIVQKKLTHGDLQISEDGLFFTGNLTLID